MRPSLVTIVAALSLAACATGASLSDQQRLEIHRAHAGEPVGSFHNFGTLHSWTPLGDSALSVWVRPNRAYLLTLAGHCPGLEFARAISLGDQSGRIHAGVDTVRVIDSQSQHIPCRISTIQPLDTEAVKQGERAARSGGQASGAT